LHVGPEQHEARDPENPPFVVSNIVQHLVEHHTGAGPAFIAYLRFERPFYSLHRQSLLDALSTVSPPVPKGGRQA